MRRSHWMERCLPRAAITTCTLFVSSAAGAEPTSAGAEPTLAAVEPISAAAESASEQPEEKESGVVSLGARGFGGVLFEEESGGLYGGGLLVGVSIVRHLEIEGSVAVAKGRGEPAFVVVEGVFKWVLEKESPLAPHLTLGPLISIDIEGDVQASGGLIAGGGATYFTSPVVGITTDLNYRLLIGDDVGHAITLALGVTIRPF